MRYRPVGTGRFLPEENQAKQDVRGKKGLAPDSPDSLENQLVSILRMLTYLASQTGPVGTGRFLPGFADRYRTARRVKPYTFAFANVCM